MNSRGSFTGLTTDNLFANKLRSCLQVNRHASWRRLGLSWRVAHPSRRVGFAGAGAPSFAQSSKGWAFAPDAPNSDPNQALTTGSHLWYTYFCRYRQEPP